MIECDRFVCRRESGGPSKRQRLRSYDNSRTHAPSTLILSVNWSSSRKLVLEQMCLIICGSGRLRGGRTRVWAIFEKLRFAVNSQRTKWPKIKHAQRPPDPINVESTHTVPSVPNLSSLQSLVANIWQNVFQWHSKPWPRAAHTMRRQLSDASADCTLSSSTKMAYSQHCFAHTVFFAS